MKRISLAALAIVATASAGAVAAVHQTTTAAPKPHHMVASLHSQGTAATTASAASSPSQSASASASGSATAPPVPSLTPLVRRPSTSARHAPPATPAAPATSPRHGPLVLAHRGGLERARENTMAAFNDAIAIGADYIETDVRHSSDGVAFLLHDPTLSGACTPYPGQAIRALTAEQVAQVRCGGQPIPRLSELVARLQRPDAARLSVMPEVKDVDPLGIRDALAPLGWRRVLVQSFNLAALQQIEEASPQVRTCPLIWGADALDSALAVTHDCVAPDFHAVDASFVAKAHAAGAVVFPFTVDDPATMHSLATFGVDGVITNTPRLARATFAS